MSIKEYAKWLSEHNIQLIDDFMDLKNMDDLTKQHDKVNHPKHYTSHPSGIEAIEVCEHMSFNLGNALKYIWRADLKGEPMADLRKAIWYLNREIEKRINNE